ncbi:uncharacterized protein F4822DRAFT_220837 [Hypoxylon trugodes]|uniref:uncharacterized protein n=1 Tax=Hypoxylon trugodes TaxID=326681 RepID=UPI00219C472C|nr:uncharacterized protein F4822DRAFT_220837 [Hypoxylon trugodes]KAI1390011.1 hypothetical protein F4822DRAFT_220837 [Hypoxylon trugodes]
MFARLRLEKSPSPLKNNSPTRQKALKRRLFLDEDEEHDDARPPSPKKKKQTHYSVATLFDKYKKPRADEEDRTINRYHSRRHRPSRSPEPDPPLVTELDERYTHLRATLHSAAHSLLETAETNLVTQSESSIRANRQKAATLETQLNRRLTTPLIDLTVDYAATGPDGRARTAAVAIRGAVSAFEESLASASDDLDQLWTEWAEAQAEIDELLLLSDSESSGSGSRKGLSPSSLRTSNGDSVTKGISASSSHAEVLGAFKSDLDSASKDVVEEMMTYEEKFLKEIEKEAGNILHSFLNR